MTGPHGRNFCFQEVDGLVCDGEGQGGSSRESREAIVGSRICAIRILSPQSQAPLPTSSGRFTPITNPDPLRRRDPPTRADYGISARLSASLNFGGLPRKRRPRCLRSADGGILPTSRTVKVFGCRPAAIDRLGVGRRTETAHARTRGVGSCRYGDLWTGRQRRQPDDGRPVPLAFDAERRGRAARAPVEDCSSVRQGDLVVASMAAE